MDAFSYVWVLLAIPVLLNVIGVLTFRNVNKEKADAFPVGVAVCFRIVTRGTNVEAVLKSAQAVQAAMAHTPLFPYSVEVVTDNGLPYMHNVRTILVPKHFRTASRARFKARALHYALEISPISDRTWLFHLDEETHITPSVIRGIHSAVCEEERSGELRIGQGVVLYHRDLSEHPFLTLADSVRTGDDLGRFRLQHLFGQSAFGMHGSFILVRNDVEKEVGFDLGPAGSVTEDAWWSLVEMAQGRRSRWVDGYCLEQSTQSVMDFLKQRRRWFVGLCLVCLRAPAHALSPPHPGLLGHLVGRRLARLVERQHRRRRRRRPHPPCRPPHRDVVAGRLLRALPLGAGAQPRPARRPRGTGASPGTWPRSCSCPSTRSSRATPSSTAWSDRPSAFT